VLAKPFSPETLAQRWGCSGELVRQMCRRGELGYFRLGKLIRIPANEVERLECQNTALCGTETNGVSPTQDREAAFESRLERLTGESPKLALVQSGAPAPGQSRRG
jgi:excisionase family DNA binding protein